MSNTVLNLRLLLLVFRVSRKLIVVSSCLGLLNLLSTTAIARASLAPLVALSQNPSRGGDVQAKLKGQWQVKNSSTDAKALTLIFTTDGKLFILLPGSSATQHLVYKIDSMPQPMHLDVSLPGNDGMVMTIFELTADGGLRLQLAGTNPGQPRPTAFDSNATVFQKVSEATTLPPNVRVIDPEKPDSETPVKPEQPTEGKQLGR